MSQLALGMLILWIVSLVLSEQKRALVSTDLLFHFAVLLCFHLRNAFADGHLASWLIFVAITQWVLVLWLHTRKDRHDADASIFLAITLISPFFVPILNERWGTSMSGIAIWAFLPVHAAIATLEDNARRLPWQILCLLAACFVSIFTAVYAGSAVQFFLFTFFCVLLYCSARTRQASNVPIAAAYVQLALTFSIFFLTREFSLLVSIGPTVLGLRHHLLDYTNTTATTCLLFTAMLLGFAFQSKDRFFQIVCRLLCVPLALLEFLTYSRTGWLSYAVFVALSIAVVRKKALLVPAMAAVGILAVLLVVLPATRERSAERFTYNFGSRFFVQQLAVESIADRPLTGYGWTNWYAHTAYIKNDPQMKEARLKQIFSAVRDHSMALDLLETGGLPLLAAMILVVAFHLRGTHSSPVFFAALVAMVVNGIGDTGPFWIVLYVHFWVLLALLARTKAEHGWKQPAGTIVLAVVFLAGAALPLIEDRLLLESTFHRNINRVDEAIDDLQLAHVFVFWDAKPLEELSAAYLAKQDVHSAERALNSAMALRRNFAPYYAELGRIQRVSGQTNEALQSLNRAVRLDPFCAYHQGSYLQLALLFQEKGMQPEFSEAFVKAFLLQQSGYFYEARAITDALGQDRFLNMAMNFVEQQNVAPQDRYFAVKSCMDNLIAIRKADWANALLTRAIQRKDLFEAWDFDELAIMAASYYLNSGDVEDARRLESQVHPETANFIRLQQQVAQSTGGDLRDTLREALRDRDFTYSAFLWEQYWSRKNDHAELHDLYETMLRLPVPDFDSSPYLKNADQYFADHDYARAAAAYHDLSQVHYTEPAPHWFEARAWQLAGQGIYATNANRRLQSLIDSNLLTENLYRSNIQLPKWQITVTNTWNPNSVGGQEWRTIIMMPPPATITLPPDVKINRIAGDINLVWGAWIENCNGSDFRILDDHGKVQWKYTIDQRSNPGQQNWNPFQWQRVDHSSGLSLQTDPRGDASYDWAVWSIRSAH